MSSLFQELDIIYRLFDYTNSLFYSRNKELEQLIATSPRLSYLYAKNIGGRFEYGEEVIATSEFYKLLYKRLVETL